MLVLLMSEEVSRNLMMPLPVTAPKVTSKVSRQALLSA
jgi:hypothetical protein